MRLPLHSFVKIEIFWLLFPPSETAAILGGAEDPPGLLSRHIIFLAFTEDMSVFVFFSILRAFRCHKTAELPCKLEGDAVLKLTHC